MKDRPILFSGPMVSAILDGRKTQTRRVIKPQPVKIDGGVPYRDPPKWGNGKPGTAIYRCPYGMRGDRLWVRETFCRIDGGDYAYKSTDAQDADAERCRLEYGYKWTPSIFMPRWASRITLEIVSMHVERVQEIDEADAKAEGCERRGPNDQHGDERSYYEGYRELWDSINAKRGYGWDKNPYVWVIEFTMRLKQPNTIVDR